MRSEGGDSSGSTKTGHVLWPTLTLARPRRRNSTSLETPQAVTLGRGGSSRARGKEDTAIYRRCRPYALWVKASTDSGSQYQQRTLTKPSILGG